MIESGFQPRLVGFAGHAEASDQNTLRLAIREELHEIKGILGPRVTAFSSVGTGADLAFMRACVDLRIPMILISPHTRERLAENFRDIDDWNMAEQLISVALAKYVVPEAKNAKDVDQSVNRHLLEFADAFLFTWHDEPGKDKDRTEETISEARELGIPVRIMHADGSKAHWSFDPDVERGARHGFETRKELLEFFDARLTTPFS